MKSGRACLAMKARGIVAPMSPQSEVNQANKLTRGAVNMGHVLPCLPRPIAAGVLSSKGGIVITRNINIRDCTFRFIHFNNQHLGLHILNVLDQLTLHQSLS